MIAFGNLAEQKGFCNKMTADLLFA